MMQNAGKLIVLSAVAFVVCVSLSGCEILNLFPRNKASKTDVASSQKGGPSAEVSISLLSAALLDEADHKPCPPAWGTYDKYWRDRMWYFANHESREYYDRVFRDFTVSRLKLGLTPISVPDYDSLRVKPPKT